MVQAFDDLEDKVLPKLQLFRPNSYDRAVRSIYFNWYISGVSRTVDLEMWWWKGDSTKERLNQLSIGLTTTTDDNYGGKAMVDGRWLTVNGAQVGGTATKLIGNVSANTQYNLQFTLASPADLEITQTGRMVVQLDFDVVGDTKYYSDDYYGEDYYKTRRATVLASATPIYIIAYVYNRDQLSIMTEAGWTLPESTSVQTEIDIGKYPRRSTRGR